MTSPRLISITLHFKGSWEMQIRLDAGTDTDVDTDTSHFKMHFCIYTTVNIHTYCCLQGNLRLQTWGVNLIPASTHLQAHVR